MLLWRCLAVVRSEKVPMISGRGSIMSVSGWKGKEKCIFSVLANS